MSEAAEQQHDGDEAVPVLLRTVPASDWLEELKSPAQTERRMEAILGIAAQLGAEQSRMVMEAMERRRWEVLACFGDEPLTPGARQFLNYLIDAWLATRFDWEALTATYAAQVGKAPEDVLADARAQQARIAAEAAVNYGPPVPESEIETDSANSDYIIPAVLEQVRIAPPLVNMDQETERRELDSGSDSEFNFERFSYRSGLGPES